MSGVACEVAVFLAEVVADDAVDDERAVDVAGRGEDFAAGQVAPLSGRDEAARLDPLEVGIEGRPTMSVPAGVVARISRAAAPMLDHARAQAVDLVEVGAHALAA